MRSFVTHCNSEETCYISAHSIAAYTPDYLTQSAFQHLKSVEALTEIEYSTHLLTKYMSNAELRAEAAEWITNPRRQILAISSFKRNQVLSIPLFFGSDATCEFVKAVGVVSKQQPEVHQSSLGPALVPNIESGEKSTTQRQQDVRSSLRCMMIPAYKEDAVCRECLTMHSDVLAVRTYYLFSKTRIHSAELCVFASNYEISDITDSFINFFLHAR